MQTTQRCFYVAVIALFGLFFGAINTGCGNSGGMTAEEIRRETDEATNKQKKISDGKAKLLSEISQIPAQEKLTKTPYVKGYSFPILEKLESEKEYQWNHGLIADTTTGEWPAANTLSIAFVDYKKEPAGTYIVPEDKTTVPGYILIGNLTLVDNSIPAVIFRKSFRGEKAVGLGGDVNTVYIPKGAKEVVGKKPFEEIDKFLNSLPRK